MRQPPQQHRLYPFLAAAAALIMLLRLIPTVGEFSPTIDEPCHIGAAVSMVEAHKLIALVSHPPLARWVAVVPLWLDGARLPQCRGQTTVSKEDLGYALGTQVLYHSPVSFRTLLIHARLAMLVFPLLSLLYLYLLGRWLANGLVAFLAVAFFSTDPTFLGHAFWIGTDAAACAGYLASLYHALRWLRAGTWRGAIFAGIAIGLAIAAKFSCLIVLPALALIALAAARDAQSPPWKSLLAQFAAVAAVAFIALWATYLFNVGPLVDQTVLGNPPQWQHLPAWVRDTPVPMPSFFLGVARLAAHDRVGHAAYLDGQVRSTGWWYYFPELLAIKSPLAFLIALTAAMILWLISRQWRHWLARATLIPAGLFLFVSMFGRIDIGIRHILPLIPLLYLFVAWQLARPGRVWFLTVLILGAFVETAAVAPDYLSYFNVAVGGPVGGARLALDSNLDWNQDVYRLAAWIKSNAHGRRYAIRLNNRRNKPLLRDLGLNPDSLDASPLGALLCISKNARLIDGRLPWLRDHQPIAHIGYSIDVYDLTGPASPNETPDHPPPDDPTAQP